MPEDYKEGRLFDSVTGNEILRASPVTGGITKQEGLTKSARKYFDQIHGGYESKTVTLNTDDLPKGLLDVVESNFKIKKVDNVNHPSHYNQYSVEVIEVIEAITARFPPNIRYHIGNLIKYVCRAPFKGKAIEDLKKGLWCLNRAQASVIAKVSQTTDVIYTIDLDTFINDLATGYEPETYIFAVSILEVLAGIGAGSEDVEVAEVLNSVELDLKKLIKAVEKYTG